MKFNVLRTAALLAVLLAGCGRGNRVQTEAVAEDTDTRLGESVDIDFGAWLKLPRKELAKLHDEWSVTVEAQLDAARKAPERVELLPRLHPRLTLPVFHEAKYSPALDLTLPDYAWPGAPDSALAWHLARFGDHEAAVKLAPEDKALLAAKPERNYPVEWTRLVALVQFSSQLKLATGDVLGPTQLVLLHRQLTKLLDAKAQAGPLGAALLPAGRRALQDAARTWREPKRNKTALAGDINNALAEWGKLPDPAAGLPLGQSRQELAGALGAGAGKALVLHKPAEVARALDLLALPLPRDGARAVAAFFDDKGRLSEVLLAYRSKIDTLYPTPRYVAIYLDERGFTAAAETKTGSLHRQSWESAGVTFEVIRSDRGNSIGGLVRLAATKEPPGAGNLSPRETGLAHLDRGFQATRSEIAPEQAGPLLGVKSPAAMGLAAKALAVPAPSEAMVARDKDQDVLASVSLAWAAEQNGRALEGLLPALWAAYGSARPEGVESAGGAFLAWTWERDDARAQLRLPFNDGPPLLVVEDTRGKDKLPARAEAARKRDAEELQARVSAGKPRVRLARSPGRVNDFSLEGLQLGQGREAALAALPTGKSYRVKDFGPTVGVVILTTPPKGATYWARQVFVRFGEGDKVNEVRVRYHEGLGTAKKAPSLAERLADEKAGAPEALPPTWAGMWADLPRAGGQPVHLRWQDDLTVRSFQRDPWGAELTLRDRAVEPAPLLHVGQGVKGAALGAARDGVRAALKGPTTIDAGAEIYRQPASSPYDAVFVYYTKDKVTRVLARHRGKVEPADAARALQAAWGRSLDQLGYVRRQEAAAGADLGAMYWFDDRVRVKTYVNKGDKEARLYTEWREWPVGK